MEADSRSEDLRGRCVAAIERYGAEHGTAPTSLVIETTGQMLTAEHGGEESAPRRLWKKGHVKHAYQDRSVEDARMPQQAWEAPQDAYLPRADVPEAVGWHRPRATWTMALDDPYH